MSKVEIIIAPVSNEQVLPAQRQSIAEYIPSIEEKPKKVDPPQPPKDHFAIDDSSIGDDPHGESWGELTLTEKTIHVLIIVGKICIVLVLLYFFICSLDLLSVGLRILGGYEPHKIFSDDTYLKNPVIGLMCGILFTIVVQSSSTTSSAVVGLVAGKIITIDLAIPIIMGANIGTSVTNTLFAMMQVDDKDRFRRAFAAATIHDMFNWLTTLVLLPIETVTGYLHRTSNFFVKRFNNLEPKDNNTEKLLILKSITEPLTSRIVLFDDDAVHEVAINKSITLTNRPSVVVKNKGTLFDRSDLSDTMIGLIVVLISFTILLLCLFCIVKTLESLLKGKMAVLIRKFSNANLPYCPFLTEYFLILMGALMTFVVQSSSAFTSTLPPLVSIKAISLERAYPLTLGSNLGTTTTAIIAAMALTKNITEGLQIALCHFLFNLTGILLFFPVPCTRFPIGLSKFLGNTTAQYRWFAIFYVVVLFVFLPLLFMSLAFAGSIYVIVTAIFLFVLLLLITLITYLQRYPQFLPKLLRTWDWLPEWMRSLEPYDKFFQKCKCCKRLNRLSVSKPPEEEEEKEAEEMNSLQKEGSVYGGDAAALAENGINTTTVGGGEGNVLVLNKEQGNKDERVQK